MKRISLDFINKKHTGKTHLYTDGSKDPDSHTAGAAFVVPAHDIFFPNISVFTTELITIEYAIFWILRNKIPKAVILTDSLSTVQAQQSEQSKTRLDKINTILSLLDKAMAQDITIEIEWIPSHAAYLVVRQQT